MKTILVWFDTLRKCSLEPYGNLDAITPNFKRLAEHSVAYDNHYAGSLPCMPARRELHTGRYNFLHREWGPIEPYDDSMPELLKNHGIFSYLVSDHYHYWDDGGATYHSRYSGWENVRGHEMDPWKADLNLLSEELPVVVDRHPQAKELSFRYVNNMNQMKTPETSTVYRVFSQSLEFINANKTADNWFLQIENFCPHEPFYSYEEYRSRFPAKRTDKDVTWSMVGHQNTDEAVSEDIQNDYRAALLMCDENLGRLLDVMDEEHMWEDTMLIVTTDHGAMLGEHEEWGKNLSAHFNEVANIPLFIWDPRTKERGMHSEAFNQTIDLAPTILTYFGIDIPKDMQGRPITAEGCEERLAGLYGTHGGYTCVTDGRYTYMRSALENVQTYQYGLMPTTLFQRYSCLDMQKAELAEPFSFTKGCKVLKIPRKDYLKPAMWRGNVLFDVKNDPNQEYPIEDKDVEQQMIDLMIRLMKETDAPKEQYTRLGLPHDE